MDQEVMSLARRLWDYHHLNLPLEASDCIIGLGSYDLRVAERCADLYHEGWGPMIVFSGYLGNWTRLMWQESEAEIFAKHAMARGVPPEKIILEAKSTNIGENIQFSRELLRAAGLRPDSVTFVSKPSTERRILATSQKLWPEMKIGITSPRIDLTEQLRNGIQEKLIHEMVGDLQRMKVYPDLGFQVAQEMPEDVWAAYQKLVSLGFDQHLIK